VLFRHDDADTHTEIATLYMQEMARRNVFAVAVNYFCTEHTDQDVDDVLEVARQTFSVIARAIDSGDAKSYLDCPVKQSGFRRLV
jgi:hypothetical protein